MVMMVMIGSGGCGAWYTLVVMVAASGVLSVQLMNGCAHGDACPGRSAWWYLLLLLVPDAALAHNLTAAPPPSGTCHALPS